jgi:hypothetical protein
MTPAMLKRIKPWVARDSTSYIFANFIPTSETRVTKKRAVPTAQLTPANTQAYLKEPCPSRMIFPTMGPPVKAAMAARENAAPVRVPICANGEIFAQSAGVRLIPAPEEMPKRAAKTIRAAFPVAGSHIASMRIVVRADMTIMTLKWPTLSATTLGIVRPKMLEDANKLLYQVAQRWVSNTWLHSRLGRDNLPY